MDALELLIQNVRDNKKETDQKLDAIDRKIEQLLQFKWQIIGGSAVISLIVGIVCQLILSK